MLQYATNEANSGGTESENWAAAFIVIFISIAATLGNGLVLLSFSVCPKLRSQPSNWFVFNLALCDFMSSLYVQIPTIINLAKPSNLYWGSYCNAHSFFTWTIMTSSNWTLAAISIDRAIAMNRPFQHLSCVTFCKVRCFIISTWLCSFTLSTILVTQQIETIESSDLMCSPAWTSENAPKAYMAAIVCFWVPSIILVISNISIIYAVRHLTSVVFPSVPEATQQNSSRTCINDHAKTLRSLYILVVVYCICISPYFIAKFSYVKRKNGLLPKSMLVLTIILMFLASAINPFIYSILRKDYNEACLKVIRKTYEVVMVLRSGIFKKFACLSAEENL